MRTVRSLAHVLFYLSRFAAVFFILTTVYSLLSLGITRLMGATWVPIHISDNTFTIYYPFTTIPFVLGPYTTAFIVVYFGIFAFYGLFLWLLGGVFNAFRQQRLFTSKNVSRLTFFYLANIIFPVLCILLYVIFEQDLREAIVISLLHMVAGIFAFFMAAIFRQGLLLQEEQDLTL